MDHRRRRLLLKTCFASLVLFLLVVPSVSTPSKLAALRFPTCHRIDNNITAATIGCRKTLGKRYSYLTPSIASIKQDKFIVISNGRMCLPETIHAALLSSLTLRDVSATGQN